MAIADDFSIATNGDIRYTGTGTNYTVIEFHRYLGDKMDDAQATGDDLLDITSATASERSTDNIITLNSPYNIDDVVMQHLYDGSIIQNGGADTYDGIVNFGTPGVYIYLIQNGAVLAPNYWTTGINADATQGISHRFMVKVRSGGTDIDGRKIIGVAREWDFTYTEFTINATARGNNVLALSHSDDLNNETAIATAAGWTTITNAEGYRNIDVNNDTTDEYYYSEWNRDTFTINQLYERTKWLSRRSLEEDFNTADTGTSFTVDDATITGAAQSFQNGANAQYLTRVRFRLKKTGSPTGNMTAQLWSHSGVYGTSSVPNVLVATSDTLDTATLTTSYLEYEFRFSGAQLSVMTASTDYCLVLEHLNGGAADYVQVEGLGTSGTHSGNRSHNTAGWTAVAADDLWFEAYASPQLYGIPGELFRGITHQVDLTGTVTGTFNAVEPVSWGSGATAGTGQMLAIQSTTGSPTDMWIQLLTGVAPGASLTITGGTSSATVSTNTGTPSTARTISTPYFGQSTGSAMIGAYGLGVEYLDLAAADKVTALDTLVYQPPNNVTFDVKGLVVTDHRLLVTAEDGAGGLDYDQLTLSTDLTGATETAVVCTASIPVDTPATGTIRIQLNTGIYRRVTYTSYATATFTIPSTDFSGANQATGAKNIFVSYIDKNAATGTESFTTVYNADRTLFIRARDGAGTPLKTSQGTATLGSNGGEFTVSQISDA